MAEPRNYLPRDLGGMVVIQTTDPDLRILNPEVLPAGVLTVPPGMRWIELPYDRPAPMPPRPDPRPSRLAALRAALHTYRETRHA